MNERRDLLAEIEARLNVIRDPCSVAMRDPMSLVEMGLIEDIALGENGCVTVTMCLTDTSCVHFNGMVAYITDALMPMAGITEVRVRQTLDTLWTDDRLRRRA